VKAVERWWIFSEEFSKTGVKTLMVNTVNDGQYVVNDDG